MMYHCRNGATQGVLFMTTTRPRLLEQRRERGQQTPQWTFVGDFFGTIPRSLAY
jgi:hypothetical protein